MARHVVILPAILAITALKCFLGDAFQNHVAANYRRGSVGNRLRVLHAAGSDDDGCNSRRDFVARLVFSSIAFGPSLSVKADDNQDLTSQLFNPDGSLKEGITAEEAKSRTLEFTWDRSDNFLAAIDGTNTADTVNGSYVRLSYQVPEKWGRGSDLYLDRSEGVNAKACERITVYKSKGSASLERLEKATSIGIGKALDVDDGLAKIRTADIIGGRKQMKGEQKYYEFDMASAPETCGKSKDNLGLGFCPFDTIFLISATVLDDSLFVIVVECDNDEWKQGNADLKRARSSFTVELL